MVFIFKTDYSSPKKEKEKRKAWGIGGGGLEKTTSDDQDSRKIWQ